MNKLLSDLKYGLIWFWDAAKENIKEAKEWAGYLLDKQKKFIEIITDQK
mgnify:CR=1 FL=1